jgi:molybdenum cofactor synthesis domain-containing protein
MQLSPCLAATAADTAAMTDRAQTTPNETAETAVTAALLIIGNEILSGRTQDANLNYIAKGCEALGVRLREVRVVPDIEDEIVAGLDALRHRYSYVFTTGGIGPTHDDITAAAVAKAFGLALHRDPEAMKRLQGHYAQGDLTEARLKMTEMPVGSVLIDNPVTTAPGFQIGNVFVMAGVPAICRGMFDGLRNRLVGGPLVVSRTVSCPLAEGVIAADLAAIQARYPALEIGSYPYFRRGVTGTALVLRGTDEAVLDQAAEAVRAMVVTLGGEPT